MENIPSTEEEKAKAKESRQDTICERILEHTHRLFSRFGIRSVTMDQVAQSVGISKKTLYQYFEDKQTLVQQTFSGTLACQREEVWLLAHKAENPIKALLDILVYTNRRLAETNPIALYELQKFFPKAWEEFFTYKEKVVKVLLTRNLQKGIESGFYRKELNIEIIVQMHVKMIEAMLDPDVFPHTKFSPVSVNSQYLLMFLYGISTPEGYALIDQYKPLFLINEKDFNLMPDAFAGMGDER